MNPAAAAAISAAPLRTAPDVVTVFPVAVVVVIVGPSCAGCDGWQVASLEGPPGGEIGSRCPTHAVRLPIYDRATPSRCAAAAACRRELTASLPSTAET